MKLSNRTAPRNGMALIAALVAMAVLSVIVTIVTVQVVKQRQMIAQRHRQLQADWLIRAGIESAAARLLDSPAGFRADKQEIAPNSNVRIIVEKSGTDRFAVTVEAEVGVEEGPVVARSGTRHFLRSETGGVVRLQAVLPDKK
jgi:type II secretory pathway pseudopilin PulG